MSADNGVYIHKFLPGWKVCHAQAIENVYSYDTRKGEIDYDKYNYKILNRLFGKSPIFKTREAAFEYAMRISNILGWTEYGIQEI